KKYGSASGVNGSNPNYDTKYEHWDENRIDVVQTFDLNYKFPKFVELDAKYGLNYENDPGTKTYDNQSTNANAVANRQTGGGVRAYNGNDLNGEIDQYTYNDVFQNFLGTGTVRLDFQNDFHLKIPLVSTTQGAFDYRHNVSHGYDSYSVGLPAYQPVTA